MKKLFTAVCIFSIAAFAAVESQAQTQQVRVTVTSNAPAGGNAITPLWVGFHDGGFDLFDVGSTASAGLEEIAETGSAATLAAEFGVVGSRLGGQIGSPTGPPPIQPGESVTSGIFDLDATENQFFSYASMVLPSSDYFIGNGNPTARDLSSIFGGGSISFNIGGTVWDAGTEVNDFATSPGNGLFGIDAGDGAAGVAEDGTIAEVTGDPYANFLNTPAGFDFSALNFNDGGQYPNGLATVTITAVPEPTSLGLISLGLCGFFARRRRS